VSYSAFLFARLVKLIMSEVKISSEARKTPQNTTKTSKTAVPGSIAHNHGAGAQRRIQELQVLESELKSMKKGGRVYKQQPNSNIFFRQEMVQTLSDAKKEVEELIAEYKDAEKSEEESECN